MEIKELKAALVSKGWNEDAYGHHKKTVAVTINGEQTARLFRVKIQKLSVRLERRTTVSDKSEWFKVTSCYLKDIKVREDGALIIGGKIIK